MMQDRCLEGCNIFQKGLVSEHYCSKVLLLLNETTIYTCKDVNHELPFTLLVSESTRFVGGWFDFSVIILRCGLINSDHRNSQDKHKCWKWTHLTNSVSCLILELSQPAGLGWPWCFNTHLQGVRRTNTHQLCGTARPASLSLPLLTLSVIPLSSVPHVKWQVTSHVIAAGGWVGCVGPRSLVIDSYKWKQTIPKSNILDLQMIFPRMVPASGSGELSHAQKLLRWLTSLMTSLILLISLVSVCKEMSFVSCWHFNRYVDWCRICRIECELINSIWKWKRSNVLSEMM